MMDDLNVGQRYRSLTASVAVLLALIVLLLAFTFYASGILERNAVLINEVNQVSNSSQAVIKDLFDVDNSRGEDVQSPHLRHTLQRLDANKQLIDTNLQILSTGGTIEKNGELIEIEAASSESVKNSLNVASEQWALLSPKIGAYLKDAQNIMVDSSEPLSQAITQAKTSSLRINESLDEMVAQTVQETNRQATIIRTIQIIGVGIILAYFLVFVLIFMRRLREADEIGLAAQRETQEIMQTVNTGLFLLDKDLSIGNQYSNALVDILGTNELAGEKLSSVLRNRISDKDLRTTEEYVEQLYNPRVKEKLVDSLNPLSKVLLHDSVQVGGDSRYLDFKFSRVYDNKEIVRILVNVNDVSEAVKLEKRLEKERAENDLQIEMLTTILSVNPRLVNEFIGNVYARIDRMNTVLKNPGSSQFELEGKLKSVYREMHSLKGEASALKLHSFTKIASEAEDKLHAMQNQGRLSGNDFLSLAVHLDELLTLSKVIAGLGQRISEATSQIGTHFEPAVRQVSASPATTISDGLIARPDAKAELGDYLVQFGLDVATRQGKAVDIDVSQLAGQNIPEELSGVVREICVQLMRNALVHGIADSETRVKRGKSYRGKITVALKEGDSNNCFMFSVEDDGQGIDYDGIRQALVAKGSYTDEQAAKLSEPQLLNALFSSGLSTRSFSDEDGGRGVGLDLVKERVKTFGGKVSVQSERGKFTRFIIKLPMPNK